MSIDKGEEQESEKSDHKSIDSFENLFQRHKHKKKLFDHDRYDVITESFDDFNSFMDWNQPLKFDVITESFDDFNFFMDWNQPLKFKTRMIKMMLNEKI